MVAIEDLIAEEKAAFEALPEGEERVSAFGRYRNDACCQQALFAQGACPLDGDEPTGPWTLQPA